MWDVGLANLFKERNQKEHIGPCLGKVESSAPLTVSILDGLAILEKGELYVKKGLSLTAGEEVLLIPAENEQVFFIVDIFEKAGG